MPGRQPVVESGSGRLRRFVLPGIAFYAVLMVIYGGVGFLTAARPAHDVTTPWDRAIPLVPECAWIYATYWVFPLLPLLVIHEMSQFRRLVLSGALAVLSGCVVFLLFPVSVPEPVLGSSLSEQLLATIYSVDAAGQFNNLPSLHVATSLVIAFSCKGQGLPRAAEMLILAQALLITVSTVLVKQHVIADTLLGIVWGIASWHGAVRLEARFGRASGGARPA